MKKKLQIYFSLLILFSLFSCGISKSLHDQPQLTNFNQTIPNVIRHSDTLFSSGDNYLIKNKQQLWELSVKGDALQRGLLTGSLSQGLIQQQERIFFSKVNEIVPSKFKQRVLRQFLKWYNRKLYLNIPEEYKAEIYGISEYASDEYNFIASPYLRSLYLHGAHDIGHALKDLALVGCSSAAVWGNKTEDGKLLMGRNFDFFVGDEFAKEKIIAFVTPDKGHPFMMVTWGGMVGVVSGMNKEGLAVTINAGKSKIPFVARTPISILTREILQYASTIEEAVTIAKRRKIFVSESIMVGSAKDKRAMLIEVSPTAIDVYEVPNSNQLICTNHFQSKTYVNDKRNKKQIQESHSQYRFERMEELLIENDKINPMKMAQILRNKEGIGSTEIGYGNEKSLNQLLAHHGIIFQPESLRVWVSSNPYQLGEFVAYDLNKIFNQKEKNFVVLGTDSLNIPKDSFVDSQAYKDYENYRLKDDFFDETLKFNKEVSEEFIREYQSLNPNYWEVYYKTGKFYYGRKQFQKAKINFELALTKEITTMPDKTEVEKYLKKIKRKIKLR